MGTSQSQMEGEVRGHGATDSTLRPSSKTPSSRAKPSPPSQPQATDIAHNHITLSWQPPRHHCGNMVFAYTIEMTSPADPKAWTVVTKSCQGNSYQVKNLSPNTQYLFRVRAENIHGVSKGSRPSEVMETKMFGVEQQLYTPAPEHKPRNVPRRQHSICLHLEGAVTSILNHTDIQVNATNSKEVKLNNSEVKASSESEGETRSSSEVLADEDCVDGEDKFRSNSLQRNSGARTGFLSERYRTNSLQRDLTTRSSLQPDRSRTSSLQREANLRNSLQPTRKKSLPLLLPGTRTMSLDKLRESQSFPVTTKTRVGDATDSLKRRERWRERSASDVQNSSSGSKEDVIEDKTCLTKDESSTDVDLKPAKRDSGLEEDAENPWEREDSVDEVSDAVISSQLSDDVKMEMYSTSVPDSPAPWLGVCVSGVIAHGGDGGQADFRTLRSLLHSDDIIIKPARSLPDVAGVGKKTSNTLTTIVDLEEDEESVRITTL